MHNQRKIMIFLIESTHYSEKLKKMFRFEHNMTFLEVSRNVEIWRHFGTGAPNEDIVQNHLT